MEDITPVHLLLMSNAAQAKSIMYCFDLKGSIINRNVEKKQIKPGCTLKDVNLITEKKKNIFLRF